MPLLEIDGVTVRFGGVVALDGASLDVGEGEITGLIGPNGAGKTSLLNVVSRLHRPDRGAVSYDGHDLLRLPAHALAARGLGRTLQHGELFRSLTVLENLLAGTRGPRAEARRAAREILALTGLAGLSHERAGTLPYGTLKKVALARALAGGPRLLLLDEPAAGLSDGEVEELERLIVHLRDRLGTAVLLVEHHMGLVSAVAERVHVLDFGRTIATGAPREIREHPAVLEAYLGVADAAARA